MFKNYLKTAIRNLLKHKTHSFINVFGLAVGIACCILIFSFVLNEWSYDRFHENADNIYRVINEQTSPTAGKRLAAITPFPLAPALLESYPEIKTAVRLAQTKAAVKYQEKVFSERLVFADAAIFEMFSFPMRAGNSATALQTPNAVVISEAIARKYFGAETPLGHRLSMWIENEARDFVVAGVVENVPENSSIQFGLLLPFVQCPEYENQAGNWGSSNAESYIQLSPSAKTEELERKLPAFVQRYFAERIRRGQEQGALVQGDEAMRLRLQPLQDIHLSPEVRSGLESPGNPIYSYVLSGIALLVLLIACINFMTLAISRAASRAGEVGVRKVLGAIRIQIMKQFWGEALLMSLLALLLGIALAELFLPAFNELAQKNLHITYFSRFSVSAALIGLMLFVALVAGSYPAFLLSRFQPAEVLKSKLISSRSGAGESWFRRTLMVAQFTLSIALISGAIVMSRQLAFLRTKNLGYQPEQVIVVPTYSFGDAGMRLIERVRNELSGNQNILSVSSINNAFTRGWMNTELKANERSSRVWVYLVGEDFLQTLGIQFAAGQDFPPASTAAPEALRPVIVNEALAKAFGWEHAIGEELEFERKLRIIGVVKDFHSRSLHHEIEPTILALNPRWSSTNLLVRISAKEIPRALAALETGWKRAAPSKPFDYFFLDEDVHQQYQAEARWGKIVRYASVLAIFIACLGLFGLAAILSTRRTKEIGIRKVLGASIASIVNLLSKEFVKLIFIANLLAWPLAYFAMSKWLQNFAYRIDIGWAVFALAGGLAVLIALLTVGTQAIKAALANPVEALRYE